MALSGVHVTFGYAVDVLNKQGPALPFNATSSQTMASPGTSTISAPSELGVGPLPLLSLSASAAIFYVVGQNPNINTDPRRYYDPALNAREDIAVNPGDRVAWTTA